MSVSRLSRRRGSLEETLEHGGGVCGAGLLVLNGSLEVLNSVAAFPDFFKLPGQDLRPPLPGQARLLQAQLTHLHVVFPWTEREREKKKVKGQISVLSN